ncbi:MAG: ATP-binding cassette domain-containing protein [Aliidongia sp.]
MFGGLAGAFFATRQGFISPESFNFTESATILAIVVLGGMGSQLGVVLAAMVLVMLPELAREFADYRMLLFGAAMVVIMVVRPRGLLAHRRPSILLHGPGRQMSLDQYDPHGKAPLLAVEHLSMRFGGLIAVNDLNFTAFTRDITAIIGPNGAGKTTVFKLPDRLLQAERRRLTLSAPTGDYLLEQMEGFRIARRAGVARHLPEVSGSSPA